MRVFHASKSVRWHGGEIEGTLLPFWKGLQSFAGAFVLTALKEFIKPLSADTGYSRFLTRSAGYYRSVPDNFVVR